MATECSHHDVSLLSPWEFVRKYRCNACGAVMMCACDQERGTRFLPHQLRSGSEFETQARVPVTHGFVAGTCRACRGEPEIAYPTAARPGATSKVYRYYWRELFFATADRFAAATGSDDVIDRSKPEHERLWEECEDRALEEIKSLHATSPKYVYQEKSQQEVLDQCKVEIVNLSARFAPSQGRRAALVHGDETMNAEEFACRYFADLGYSAMFTESSPLHVLFGALLWRVVQDPDDPAVRVCGFGARTGFPAKSDRMIWTGLPQDFGREGFGQRRDAAIAAAIAALPREAADLLAEFDRQLDASEPLRQYLWAHEEIHIDTAGAMLRVLPPGTVRDVLAYLAGAYWERYLGWPDLLVWRGAEWFFAEVKASDDKLSEEQKAWILDNAEILHFPFKLVKIHRLRD